jgi:PAS domain S-box-containing protein
MERDDRNWRKAYEELEERFRKRMEELTALAEELRAEIRQRVQAENDLLEVGHALRGIIDASPLAVIALDAEGRVTLWNPAAERIFGWSDGEVLGRFNPIVPEEEKETFLASFRRIFEGEVLSDLEERRRRRDGALLDISVSTAPLRDATGTIRGTIAVIADITERKREREALRETTQTLRGIVRTSPLPVFVLDLQGHVKLWNPAAERVLGWAEGEVLGHPIPTIPEDRGEEFRAFVRMAASGLAFSNVEVKRRRKDGTLLDALLSTAPLRDAAGRVIGHVVILADITERKRAEEALRESGERFRSLLENLPVGVSVARRGRLVFLNSEQRRLFGTNALSVDIRDFPGIHPEDREQLLALCDEARPGDVWREETEIRIRPEDRPENGRTVLCRAAPILHNGDRAVLITMGDITRIKELERVTAVQDRMAVLGQVAAGIAHELRNPLSGLNLYISSVERILAHAESVAPDVRDQAASALDMMKSASDRIAGVIRRVMDFIRPVPPRLTLVDLNPAIREAVQLSAAMLRRSGIRTEIRLDENLPRCYADIPSIEQVLLNLIANAAQALEAKEGDRTIAVTSGIENGNVVIAVADSGPGVPEGHRDKVFDPFFTTKAGGTGIGLSLSARIVERHAGSIDVGTSRLGGAEFRIRIPAGNKRKAPREA